MSRLVPWMAVALLFSLTPGCRTAPEVAPPQPDPVLLETRVEFTDQTISSFTASAVAGIENPRDEPLLIDRVDYSLRARGHVLREGSYELATTVPPMQQAEVTVPVGVEYSLTFEQHREVFAGDAVPVIFTGVVTGSYGGEDVQLTIERAGRMRTPRLPEVRLGTPDGARRRVDEVHATFRLELVNDNPFPVRLAWVDYVLEVEGNELRETRVGADQRLPASGAYVFTIEQDLRTSNVPVLEDVMEEDNAIDYRIHGELRMGDLVIPFDEPDEIRFGS
ncbi:MAG: hypothetical protein ACOCVR_04615 [Myxococcota bacterium]